MSGWAAKDRQPWVYGDATTAINRQYLKLKIRLTPYMYTYCNQAFETGVPAVRAMVLEFPDDPVVKDATTRYQFMSGEWFLVAPVYQGSTTRDSIYFPAGRWIDYWDGTNFYGPMFLNGYNAPVNKLPVFVKSGAIIPMYPEMLYDGQKPADTLTLDVYPDGYSSFELYEDDGITREHRDGAFSKTLIECQAPEQYGAPGIITVTINPSVGDFEGKLSERAYWCKMNYPFSPLNNVSLDDAYLQEYASLEDLMNADSGYYFDYTNSGPLYIKTPYLPTDQQHVIVIDFQVGMNDTGAPGDIRIYPNPAKNIISIKTGKVEDMLVRVADSGGRPVFEQFYRNPGKKVITVDLSGQPAGTYLVTVEQGEDKSVTKIMLTRE
jgi:hypothetical protein